MSKKITWAEGWQFTGDIIGYVLAGGDIDEHSRESLSAVYRCSKENAAILAEGDGLRADIDELLQIIAGKKTAPENDGEKEFLRTWFRDSASIHALFSLIGGVVGKRLVAARAVWISEIDAMSAKEILALPGIGPVSLVEIRDAIEAYYWRGDETVSRELWEKILESWRSSLDYKYLPAYERPRVEAGIELAERALKEGAAAFESVSV